MSWPRSTTPCGPRHIPRWASPRSAARPGSSMPWAATPACPPSRAPKASMWLCPIVMVPAADTAAKTTTARAGGTVRASPMAVPPRRARPEVYVILVGGGKVGYYLTKELLAAGHEIVLLEKDPRRAAQIADEIGSVVLNRDGCEGKHLAEAGANRAAIVAAVTGDDEDNLVVCQMSKHHFDVPRTIARVNNPRNEPLFRHLGVDEIISPTRMILGAVEQDIPVHALLHLAQLEGGDQELVEAHITADSPAVGRRASDFSLPEGCSLFALVRDDVAQPIRPATILQPGDKVIAITRTERADVLRRELIGELAEEQEAAGG